MTAAVRRCSRGGAAARLPAPSSGEALRGVVSPGVAASVESTGAAMSRPSTTACGSHRHACTDAVTRSAGGGWGGGAAALVSNDAVATVTVTAASCVEVSGPCMGGATVVSVRVPEQLPDIDRARFRTGNTGARGRCAGAGEGT